MPPEVPFALIEKQRGGMRIAALCPQAAKLGLMPGMTLADARGQVPQLISLPHDPQADLALLAKLADACIHYTPNTMADPPQGVILDISGCAHLHGGEATMQGSLQRKLKRRGLTACIAIAATPDAARALARFGGNSAGEDVRPLPIAALQVEETVQIALRRAGLRTIGDLADLPPASLAARFGGDLVRLLNRILGREKGHIVPRRTIEPIKAIMRFPEPIAHADDVMEVIETLLGQVASQLARRSEGGRAFAISLHRSDGHIARLLVETGAPTRNPALVMRLFDERIGSLSDPLDPGFGYDSIALVVSRSERLAEKQQVLVPEGQEPCDSAALSAPPLAPLLAPLLDRLAVRYGPHTILHFVAGDSHVPERGAGLRSFSDPAAPSSWQRPNGACLPIRPPLIFDPPQPVKVIAAVPDGPPKRFAWRGKTYLIIAQEGPERIAPEWWRRRGGHAANSGLSRDYYRVEDEGGHRFWLFRHGLYGRETDQPRWYVHGLFA